MSNINNDQLLELIDDTIAWASEVSELWTGTIHEKAIDHETSQLVKAVEQHDYELADNLVRHLAQTLTVAENEYEKEETNDKVQTYRDHTDYSVREYSAEH